MRLWMTETNDELKTLLVTPSIRERAANSANAVGGSMPEAANSSPMVRYIRFISTMRLTR